MSTWGVFAVDRGIWDHPVLYGGDEPLSKGEAWMWLLSAAAWKPHKIGSCGRVVHLERGEFCYSIRFLERKWKWKSGKVERFLKTLENHDMICDVSRDGSKIYSVNNYNDYQRVSLPERDSDHDDNHDDGATGPRQDRDRTATKKEHSNIQAFEEVSSLRSDAAPEPEAKPVSKPVSKPKAERGTRWPDDAVVPDDWIAAAREARDELRLEPIDLRYEATRFANYWASKAGGRALHANWRKAWMNWATDKEKTEKKNRHNGARKSTALDSHLAGIGMLISGEDEDEFASRN